MPITAAEGAISLPEDYLAATIAACARWISMTGSADATAARERVYFDSLPPPPNDAEAYTGEQLDELRPFVMIFSDEDTGVMFDHSATDTSFNFKGSGRIKGLIEDRVDPTIAHDPQEVFRRFKNAVGMLVLQLLDKAGQPGYLAIRSIVMQGPLRCHEDIVKDEGDHVQYRFTIDWGRQ